MSYYYVQTERDIAYNVLMRRLRKEAARSLMRPHGIGEQEVLRTQFARRIARLEKRYYRQSGSEAERLRREEVEQERRRRV